MDYFLWRNETQDGYCTIRAPEVDRIWELSKGISRVGDLGDGIECKMDPRRPKDVGLADNVRGAGFPVVSRALKQSLERDLTHNRVEFIPVRLVNHKGRVASDQYYVLNPLDIVDCIDLEESGVEWNRISPSSISYCKALVLKEEAIPEGFTVFRLKRWENNILARADVVSDLQSSNLTGLVFRPAAGYNGLG